MRDSTVDIQLSIVSDFQIVTEKINREAVGLVGPTTERSLKGRMVRGRKPIRFSSTLFTALPAMPQNSRAQG